MSEYQRLKKSLTLHFNRFIRERDNHICFTCGEVATDAGHFVSCTALEVRYDERNVNAQCEKCNRNLNGNLEIYRMNMIEKYGIDLVEHLEAAKYLEVKKPHQWFKDQIKHYKGLLK